jgi:hypothetical protein
VLGSLLPLILSFIDFEQVLDSTNKRASAKVLFLYGMPKIIPAIKIVNDAIS